MSIEVMRYVWTHSKSKGNNRLILLAIADMANDAGDAFPGVDRLAVKGNMSHRGAQDCIHELERSGELQVFENVGTKTVSGWTNLYRVVMPDIKQNEVRSPFNGSIVPPRPTKPKGKPRAFPKDVQLSAPDEGVQLSAPHDMQPDSPHGVQPAAPKALDYPPGEPPESNTELDSEYESTSCITREGDDDVTLRDGESESVILKGEIRAGVTASKLPGYLKAYGTARMNAAYEIAASKPNVDNPIGYMVFLLTSNSPLTPISAAPLPPASVAQSAYADWIDVGYGPGIFAPPEQPVTQGDTADDNTPALDDEQREYFRQVDAEDETTPDAEFTDMSDVIPVEIQALQS